MTIDRDTGPVPRRIARRKLLQSAVALAGTGAWAADDRQVGTVGSPNARVQVILWLSKQGEPGLTVLFDKSVLLRSPGLGLDLDEGGPLAAGLRLTRSVSAPVQDRYTLVCGKTRHVDVCCNELKLDFEEAGPASRGRRLRLVVRAYDDGAAFRYQLPSPSPHGAAIRSELTRFDFPRDFQCWGVDLGAFGTSHEGEFTSFRASQMGVQSLFDAPLVCMTGQGDVTFAIAEADLQDYAALYLARHADGGLGVRIRLPPRLDDSSVAVRWPHGDASQARQMQSPWRVILVGDHPGRLIESTLITTLSQPSEIADTAWIRPGKAAWDWWSAAAARDVAGPPMGDGAMMRLIDFAKAASLQYLLIDAGWYAFPGQKTLGPEIDVTRSVPAINLPMLVDYARRHDVGLFVWVNWLHLDAQLDDAFAFYARTGVKGVKIDFMNRDDQQMMAFYHRLLARAAACELMIDLHGATHPTGLSRTYPNLVTQEGVMGAEYNKWTRRVTSRHNVTIPYTRMLLGPMDYTPGGFRNVTPEQFVPREILPMVQTTRGHALAMYVVYDSPFSCVSDSPDTYQGAAGFDFLSAVPTSWDETRVLSGQIGRFIVIARRNGAAWFIGAMTEGQARRMPVRLDFLGPGRFKAAIYADGDAPSLLAIERNRPVARHDVIHLALAANGGGAVAIYPAH